MKSKLTVNRLAIGNLRARKKQYAIMIIGIILAMVFSSSVILFSFSAMETNREKLLLEYGKQNGIFCSDRITDADFEQAIADGYVTDYGYMHSIGFAYADEGKEYVGSTVAWLDDKALDMYNLKVLEGRFPEAPDEIAIEQTQLRYLDCKDAKTGDTIRLKLKPENSTGKVVDKQYKLVGIIGDRKTTLEERYEAGMIDVLIPGMYVAKGTEVELGGREDKVSLYKTDYSKEYQVPGEPEPTNRFTAPEVYLWQFTGNGTEFRTYAFEMNKNMSLDSIFSDGRYITIIIIALVFASCIAIINAFNTNLKERKKQIGLFRAVGTTRRQIINIFGREAFIISLIATPVSVALSYLIVRLVISIFSEDAVMSKSIWALVASAGVNIIVVMLASLVPLFLASRISPMQAIRNINVARKVKAKKIKSKKQFNASSHLARRNTKFYKGSTIAVSIMLVITICFSCLAFSFITYSSNNLYSYKYDYTVSGGYLEEPGAGITEIDRQSIESLPYVEKAYGEKSIDCEIEYDELDSFARIINNDRFTADNEPQSAEDERQRLLGEPDEDYFEIKEALGFKKEMLDTRIYSYDAEVLQNDLSKYVAEGSIDISRLASGEEIILVAPRKAELRTLNKRHVSGNKILFDEGINKLTPDFESVLSGECDYKVGDTISLATYAVNYDEAKSSSYEAYSKGTARIGAIVRPNSLDYRKTGFGVYDITIITSNEGMNKLAKGLNYSSVSFNSLVDIDDDMDEKITDDLTVFSKKYDSVSTSRYAEESVQVDSNRRALTAIIVLVLIGFVICISIVNNSITAHIRENKRVIGTLRAVGADTGDLVKSYVRQMLTMFGWGTGIGYGLFLVICLVAKIAERMIDGFFLELTFNPWITVAMTAVSFGICAVNAYAKIKKETRNSIVENIREL